MTMKMIVIIPQIFLKVMLVVLVAMTTGLAMVSVYNLAVMIVHAYCCMGEGGNGDEGDDDDDDRRPHRVCRLCSKDTNYWKPE